MKPKANTVPASHARRHLIALSRAGIGRRSVGEASDISQTTLKKIKSGRRRHILAHTERKILEITADAAGDGNLIAAGPTWARIRSLLAEGYSKSDLAIRLGYRRRALQFRKTKIRARTAMRIRILYNQIMEE